MACEKCSEGWKENESGARRCECNQVPDRSAKPPVVTEQEATILTEMLAAIPYFPSEAGARIAIGLEMRSMCNSSAEGKWLVTRMMRLYQRWPGPNELRHVLVSKFPPRDGVMPSGISECYPDGIPSEKESRRAIEAPPLKALGPGHVATADASLDAAVRKLAEAKGMKRSA